MLRIVLVVLFVFGLFLLPTTAAQAACKGRDLIKRLDPSAKARLEQEASKVPFAYGNHWIATRHGQRLHIVGTQHFGDARMHPVMRRLRPIIAEADLVMTEGISDFVKNDVDIVRQNPRIFFMRSGTKLPAILNETTWQAVQWASLQMNIPSDVLPHIQPWVFALALGGSTCNVRGITSREGLDYRIKLHAARTKTPIMALEPKSAGFRALSNRPYRDQATLLELSLVNGTDNNNFLITMRNAYFNESLTEAWLLRQWNHYSSGHVSRKEATRLIRQLDAQLLDARNLAWVPVITNRPERLIVIAAGAAHLPGKNGLLNLLQRKGYKLERARF